MSFRVQGLDPTPFRHLYGLSEEALAEHGARRYTVDAKPGFPDRVEVRDLEPGDTALLLNYLHQPADTPYRSSHAIFVREGATETFDQVGTIPEALRVRLISLRAFSAEGDIVAADVVDGKDLEPLIETFFANPETSYLHAHYAKRGCYAARIDRA